MTDRLTQIGQERLVFRAAGDWLAVDLAAFALAVHKIYESFLTVWMTRLLLVHGQTAKERAEVGADALEQGRLVNERRWAADKGRLAKLKYWLLERSPFAKRHHTRRLVKQAEIAGYNAMREMRRFMMSESPLLQPLRLMSIEISSPGLAIFDGPGIVKQIRELIRDLKFRNRQLEELGDIEIQIARLHLQSLLSADSDHNDFFPPELALELDNVVEGLKSLKELASSGKLELDPEG